MNWRKEERTEKQTSSLPAVCRADPVYSGDGRVRRFLALEISRREGILAVGRTRAEHTGGRRGVPHRKRHPHNDLSEKNNSDPFRIIKKISHSKYQMYRKKRSTEQSERRHACPAGRNPCASGTSAQSRTV